jgi:dolichyl-phosphate-mannose-protein mannosyltransferase
VRPSLSRRLLLLTLVLSALPRLAWFATHGPSLSPDSFGYLNLARELRGFEPVHTWDDKAFLPADNQATRTPGYPLFLNLVFALAGHSPSPDEAIQRAARQHVPPAPRHLQHLATDENVRAVYVSQIVLGILATLFVYATVSRWTGSAAAAMAGSLVAVGWNPVWIVMFEPALLTEVLAASILIVIIWLVARGRDSALTDLTISVLCGWGVLARPALIFAAVPIIVFVFWTHGRGAQRFIQTAGPAIALVAGLIVFNGVRYGYWGISSATGATLFSHTVNHPEALRDPIRGRTIHYKGNVSAGLEVQRDLGDAQTSYLEAGRIVGAAAVAFIVDHPVLYAQSVVAAVAEFWSPTIRLFPYDINIVRMHARWLWFAVVAAEALLTLFGAAALLMRVTPAARLSTAVFVVSSIGAALTAHTENRRFAIPVEPLLFMSATTVVTHLVRRRPPARVGEVVDHLVPHHQIHPRQR